MDTEQMIQAVLDAPSLASLKEAACLPEPDGDEGYLFVSYSHADFRPVIADIIRLRECGTAIWYDRGLETGKSWLSEVHKKISSYSCRGVLFYISEQFLASPSCMQELFHYLGAPARSCLFILLDGEPSAFFDRMSDAVCRHAPEGEQEPLLTALCAAIRKNRTLPIGASAAEKAKRAKRFAPPALLTYGKIRNSNPISALMLFRSVAVTGVLDKNVRTVRIPKYARLAGRRYRVRGIGAAAFFGCELLEDVEMARFTYVENAAFVRCPSLCRVHLQSTTHHLGFSSLGIVGKIFDGCPRATLTLGRGRIIYAGSFSGRTDLTEVALTQVRIKKHDQCSLRTFAGCTSLLAAHIPQGNVTRGLHASFEGCTALSSVSLPRRLRLIGKNAFLGCASLTAITLPPRIKGIADRAFLGCEALADVTFLGRVDHLLENTPYHRRQALDRLFPHAVRFYLKKKPALDPFDGDFHVAKSDRRGFILYERGAR